MTEEEWAALIEWFMQSGGTESQLAGTFNAIPQDPGELKLQAGQQNSYRDFEKILGSYMTGGLSGPGGWDPEAFKPTVEREVVDRPGERRLKNYLNADPMSLEGLIAGHYDGGGTSSTARAMIASLLDPTRTGYDETIAAYLLDQMGSEKDDYSGDVIPSWDRFDAISSSLEKDIYSDPLTDGLKYENGQYYRETSTPSEAAKWFSDQGLPTPNQEYTPEYMMGSDWAAEGPTRPQDYRAMMSDYLGLDAAKAAGLASLGPVPQSRLAPRPSYGYPGGEDRTALTSDQYPAPPGGREHTLVENNNFGISAPNMPGGGPGGVGASAILNAVPLVGPTLAMGNTAIGAGQSAYGGLKSLIGGIGNPFDSPQTPPATRRAGITDIPATLYNPDFTSLQDYYDAGLMPGTPSNPAAPKPPDFTTAAGRDAFGAHRNGVSTNTPDYQAYQALQTEANRAQADRFGRDFYYKAGSAKAARDAGDRPLQDALLKRRMQMMMMGMNG